MRLSLHLPLRAFGAMAAIALGLSLGGGAHAQSVHVENAKQLITELADQAVQTLSDDSVELREREQRFHAYLADNFAMRRIGRWVLGRYWKKATDAQRQEYLDLFSDFIVKKYARLFGGYTNETYEIKGARVNPNDETDVIVNIVIFRGASPLFNTDWRVRVFDGRPMITDIFVEQISMRKAQRDEFYSIVGRGDINDLIRRLREQIAKLEAEESSG